MDSNGKSTFITSLIIDIDNNTDLNHVEKVSLAEFNIPHQSWSRYLEKIWMLTKIGLKWNKSQYIRQKPSGAPAYVHVGCLRSIIPAPDIIVSGELSLFTLTFN